MAGRRRNGQQGAPPTWAVVSGMLHMRVKDVAAELNVPVANIRRLCNQNGFATWPGKRIRYRNSIGKKSKLDVDAPESSSRLAELAQLAKKQTKNKDEEEEPAANPPPKELITLDLIDKVGSSSSTERT